MQINYEWSGLVTDVNNKNIVNYTRTSKKSIGSLINSPYVTNANRKYRNNTVGSNFRVNLTAKDSKYDDFAKELEQRFMSYFATSQVDVKRKWSGSEFIKHCVTSYAIHGEAIVIKGYKPLIKDNGIKSCFTLVDPNRLIDNGIYANGVDIDQYGEIVGYNIKDNDNEFGKYVPTYSIYKEKQVLHCARTVLGYSEQRGSSVLLSVNDTVCKQEQLSNIVLDQATVQASYGTYLKSDYPPELLAAAISSDEGVSKLYNSQLEDYGCSDGEYTVTINGVSVPILRTTDELKTFSNSQPFDTYTPYNKDLTTMISGAFGLGYEDVTSDYSGTTYNSSKASQSAAWGTYLDLRSACADLVANFIFDTVCSELINKRFVDVPSEITGNNFRLFLNIKWFGAKKQVTDEVKEANSNRIKLASGEATLAEVCAENGKDWREHLEQIVKEADYMKKLKQKYNVSDKDIALMQKANADAQLVSAEIYSDEGEDED